MAHISAIDTPRPRGAATAEEIDKIVEATALMGTVKKLTAEDGATLYRIALMLALRSNECWSLCPESFIRDDDGVNVIIEVVADIHRYVSPTAGAI